MVFTIFIKSRIDFNARIGRNAGDLHFVIRIAVRTFSPSSIILSTSTLRKVTVAPPSLITASVEVSPVTLTIVAPVTVTPKYSVISVFEGAIISPFVLGS